MADSTTLMTFLVRAPPTTRSVTLLGSWDNFNKSYPMQRDNRVGMDHWTGCHSFENIICDGNLNTSGSVRDGGLKMGGTYWYYYKLDDDIEFANSSEPSTTSCPMLPGQLINVLQVPFYLSGARRRTDSISSTSSRNRTMNPSDKYLNPRPVPQPKLPRINTSPAPQNEATSAISSTSTSSPWSTWSPASSRGMASLPSSAITLKKFRLPRKESMDGMSRSVSPSRKFSGIRARFGSFRTPRSSSPEAEVRGRLGEPEHELIISGPILQDRPEDAYSRKSSSNSVSAASSRQVSPHPIAELEAAGVPASYFALRRGLEPAGTSNETFTASSFHQHRRQRSRSKEPSCLRRSLTLSDERDFIETGLNVMTNGYIPLETLNEVLSAQNTPRGPATARRFPQESSGSPFKVVDLAEKRLPTLPNTPSSVYPPSIYPESPAKQLSQHLQALQSHFSDSSIDTASILRDTRLPIMSHFSAWTTSTDASEIASDYSRDSSDFDSDSLYHQRLSVFEALGSPFESHSASTLAPVQQTLSVPSEQTILLPEPLASATSCSTISSTISTSPSSPESEAFELYGPYTNPLAKESHLRMPCDFQAYRLPDSSPDMQPLRTHVQTTPQQGFPTNHNLDFLSPSKSEFEMPTVGIRSDEATHKDFQQNLPHSENMQQLMQELSYLGDMIQK